MDAPAATGALARPVRVDARVRIVRVAAVVPCFNRPEDLDRLAADLAACRLEAPARRPRGASRAPASGRATDGSGPAEAARPPAAAADHLRIDLSVLVVDNASSPPLATPRLLSGAPHGLPLRVMRLAVNTGGSGGYNAGMAAALDADDRLDYLWLVDSDARVEPDTLARLLSAMEADPRLVLLGPALADTETGRIQEIGGRLDRRTGRFGPFLEHLPPEADPERPIPCDYAAACCVLVRAEAVRRVGLMPEVFLNADDVEWCLRLARETGGRIAALPAARAAHPRFDRFGTLPRYFGARNAFGPIDALGLGRVVRFRRAMREGLRAVNQQLMCRPDLASLHIRGLRDAARRRTRGLPTDLPAIEPPRPLAELPEAVAALAPRTLVLDLPRDLSPGERDLVLKACREPKGAAAPAISRAPSRSVAAFLRRAAAGPRFDLAVVPPKGSPAHWLLARHSIHVWSGGFVYRRVRRVPALARAAGAAASGALLGLRIAAGPTRPRPLPRSGRTLDLAPVERTGALTVSIVVLSHNRREALLETLRRLRAAPATRDAETIVVDSASTDGSARAVREQAPWATLIELTDNVAIAGFNRGVEAAAGDLVLILDDDARPDDNALAEAVRLLGERPDLGAVTFPPDHPASGAPEWPFAARLSRPSDDWTVMGCCNLVRRSVWRAVGGYDEAFFLYRNDTDLALKILAAGLGVHCNPAWRCEHDSPAAGAKSPRWCRLATRNWVWLARRHGRGWARVLGGLLGWAWAHRLAGFSARRQWSALRGGLEGLLRPPPPLPESIAPDGRAFERLLALRFGRGG